MSKAFPLTWALLALGVSPVVAQQVPTVPLGRPTATFEDPFTNLMSVRELPGGRVVAVDPRDKIVSLVDLASGSATKIGREGGGPGEYQFPRNALAMPNNETFISDPMQSRFLRLDATGKVLETVSYPTGTGPGMQIVGTDAQGRIYWEGSAFGGGGGLTFNSNSGGGIEAKDSVPVIRWDPRSNKLDTLMMVKGPQMKADVSGGANSRTVMIRQQPFTARDAWGVAPDGRVAVARATPYRVDTRSAAGQTRAGAPIGAAPLPVTEKDKQEFMKGMQNAPRMTRTVGGNGAAPPAPPAPKAEDFEWPMNKPLFDPSSVRMSPAGELWALRNSVAGDPVPVYDVFGVDGRLVRRVSFPAKTKLVGFGQGTVYAVRTDEDDLQYLERYADCGLTGCDSGTVPVGR